MSATECDHFTGRRFCKPESTILFVLRVVPGSKGYAGSLEIAGTREIDVVMNVTGVPRSDGAVLFTGTRGPTTADSRRVALRSLLLRVDQAAGLTGEIDLRASLTNWESETRLEGRVLSADYAPAGTDAGPTFSGSWRGRLRILSCSGDCSPLLFDIDIELMLGQTGDTVTGRLRGDWDGCSSVWLPVQGSATGTGVSLSSKRVVPSHAGPCKEVRLERFEARADSLRRLKGRLALSSAWKIGVGFPDRSYRIECDIRWLHPD